MPSRVQGRTRRVVAVRVGRTRGEAGFTLVELLIVILIIGILAAIALPAFLNQRQKGYDGSAKSDVRVMLGAVESCFGDAETYDECDSAAELGATGAANTVAPCGGSVASPDPPPMGQVCVIGAGTDFSVVAQSKADHTFVIQRTGGVPPTRTCTPAGEGACPQTGNW